MPFSSRGRRSASVTFEVSKSRTASPIPARSTPATLTYRLKARGEETNIAWFGGVQRGKGVSAAPWNKRRIFAHSFIVPRFGRAFLRRSKQRLPIRGVYGPNVARELVKDSSAAAWQAGVANIVARIGHEIARMLPR